MTVAAAIEGRTAGSQAWSNTSRIAGIDIFHDLGQAESIWRSLEGPRQFVTPYQRFDFLATWQRHVGEHEGFSPFIVVAHDAEHNPLVLLPLAIRHQFGVRTACFMGGKHANFNMALWKGDFAATANRSDIETLISAIREKSEADVLSLVRQPFRWGDVLNPLAKLPNQRSVNDCPLLTMTPGAAPTALISNSFRRRLKSKERKLQTSAGYRYYTATSDADIKRLLDWFFRVKPVRMAKQKQPNVFAEPGVEDFVRGACMAPLSNGGRIVDIHALECNDEIIAIFAGVSDSRRFSMMFNTYTTSGNSRYSPGLILMRHIIDHYAARGYRSLDLGIGADDYKKLFCKSTEPIFDSFVPLSPRGRIAAAAMASMGHAKRLVKRNQTLFQVLQKLRNALH